MSRINACAVTVLALLWAGSALAQAPNPACQRLEAQLASIDRGNEDPQRADAIRRAEDGVNRQQFELDRLVAQSRRMGCESSGFFSIFNTPPAQCTPLNNQIQQSRSTLERARMQLEQLNGGNTERAAQRRSVLIALSDNGCGPQYRQAAVQQPGGSFLERLFSPNQSPFFGGGDSQSGTFRTICVRTCDGYYFPISFQAPASKFTEDQAACQRLCPASEARLYTYRNPGEEVSQAVAATDGAPYTALPAAFRYRTSYDANCSCRKTGQSWQDALKAGGGDVTLAPGDVVVTEQNAKRLSQPAGTRQPAKPVAPAAAPATTAAPTGEAEPAKGSVRTVGPTFYPVR